MSSRTATKPRKKPSKKERRKARFSARTADRQVLYQLAVQSPEEDVRFLARIYRKVNGEKPRHFREDFCGTALLCSKWVQRKETRTAEGFDICGDTLAWGREHNLAPLGEAASRILLHRKDVRAPSRRRPDVRCAQNFSYFVFKERKDLLQYFRSAQRDLAPKGLFVLDIYGGPDAMEEEQEIRKIPAGFTYVWDQKRYDPATGDYLAHIHFRFRDGTEMKKAFTYDWRLWTLPEVKDVLRDAGFSRIDTYWEGTDEDGESGNGVYRRSERGENCPAWVTYVVAHK
jgi:SAM-dependent methyltransferase